MECTIHDSRLVRKPAAGGKTYYTYQCVRCGSIDYAKAGAGPWVPKPGDVDIDTLPLWDDELQRRIQEHARALADERRTELSESRRAEYLAYLDSYEWYSKRSKALERDRHLCQGCMEAVATDVHHATYERLFDELICDLVSLCRDCHNKCHPYKDLRGRELDGYALPVH